ncbi:MAG: alanyl-tRNA editing protein AlaX [Zestosphaera tikiterensis]|uniref:Alanyl-tRNA editing protein AlaX n=1 Tax=Zestosphaera tikiterensis TaxID=1973259 RepID=A0A2R7Y7V6_9CREN|nr:MAG: alanyl-tRNA editing protein AlaX [Zestosphaera tikiterensis]
MSECLNFPDEVRTHTALHIIKGAVVKVLGEGSLWTASTYVSGKHGRLTVTCQSKPSDDEIKRIEALANAKVEEDLTIERIVIPREEAEKTYGQIIYDLFPIPQEVRELTIVIVKDRDGSIWNINACNKEHLPSSKCVGKIALEKPRFRASKKLLELPFNIEP